MADAMRAQAQEIERLRMELQRTSIKQRESIPELTPGTLEEFVQEDRVAQWMRLCVGALKEFLDHTGRPMQRPLDHERANDQPPPPRDHALVYRIWEVLCKSHTAYMTPYTARSGQEPKGRSPYGSLEEARGAPMTDFHWKNVRSMEVGGILSWQTRAGEWIPDELRALGKLQTLHAERSGDASETLAFPVSPLELNTARGGLVPRCPALSNHESR